MKTYFVKTPGFVPRLYPDYRWKMPGNEKVLYLTFDDGPHPEITPWVLKMLNQFNAKATFFCVGDNIRKFPGTFKQILSEDHLAANHTFHHLNGWKTPSNTYLENIEKAALYIGKLQGDHPKYFRPPYGKIKKEQARRLIRKGYQILMWDVLSADFDTSISSEKCLQNVVKYSQNGSIIVFHDSEKAFERLQYALPKALEYFTKKGYQFKTL